jgi:hypothetical protein
VAIPLDLPPPEDEEEQEQVEPHKPVFTVNPKRRVAIRLNFGCKCEESLRETFANSEDTDPRQ